MTRRIIQRKQVLSEEAFVPEEMLHRQNQLEQIRDEILQVVENQTERHILMYGPSGTGKTSLAKHLKNQLERNRPEPLTSYVNCWTRYTRFKVLYSILEQSNHYRMLHQQLTSTEKLIDKINSIRTDKPVITILDEVDLLNQPEALYDLTGENTALIIISNQKQALLNFDQRTQSRLSGKTTVHFPQYKHQELYDILDKRRKLALRKGTLNDMKLDWITDQAAGDARKAIRIMRLAAEKAEQKSTDKITDDCIEYGINQSETVYRKKNMSRLNKHQKQLVTILEDGGKYSPADLYRMYKNKVDDPVSKKTVRRYISKLERYNLVKTQGRKRTKRISIQS